MRPRKTVDACHRLTCRGRVVYLVHVNQQVLQSLRPKKNLLGPFMSGDAIDFNEARVLACRGSVA